MSVLVFVMGLVLGSFLNVCIYRIPRGESILFPPSHCPGCNARLRSRDLVPVLSYLFLRGKCSYCRRHISLKYPVTELLTGMAFLLAYVSMGMSMRLPFVLAITAILIVTGAIALEGRGMASSMVWALGCIVGLETVFVLVSGLPLEIILRIAGVIAGLAGSLLLDLIGHRKWMMRNMMFLAILGFHVGPFLMAPIVLGVIPVAWSRINSSTSRKPTWGMNADTGLICVLSYWVLVFRDTVNALFY